MNEKFHLLCKLSELRISLTLNWSLRKNPEECSSHLLFAAEARIRWRSCQQYAYSLTCHKWNLHQQNISRAISERSSSTTPAVTTVRSSWYLWFAIFRTVSIWFISVGSRSAPQLFVLVLDYVASQFNVKFPLGAGREFCDSRWRLPPLVLHNMTRFLRYFLFLSYTSYTRWRTWLRHCATSPEVRGFDSRWCHWNFSLT